MRIYLIRHGRQNSPLCNVNVPLSEAGRRQAALTAKRLSEVPLDAVWSSDLVRAVETAQIANEIWQIPHVVRPDLCEISFGKMEGMSDEEIVENFGDFLVEKKKMERDIPYPGGECAEDVVRRAVPVLLEITGQDYSHVAVVTHGGVIRSLLCYFLGVDYGKNRLFAMHLENCSITEVDWNREEKRFYVNRINDYAHLEPYPELLRSGWSEK